jgi:nucleotide-binding universal stress UspA family protein
MRLMIASDGSVDGLDALERLASLGADPGHSVVTLVVGWPPRGGVMWQDVYERQIISDDLHRALEETVEHVSARLRRIGGSLAREVTSRIEDGDGAEQLAAVAKREGAEMLMIGATGGPGRRHAHEVTERTMELLHIPIVVVYGTHR